MHTTKTLDLKDYATLDALVAADPWISSRSRWSSEIWEFDVDAPGYSSRKLAQSWRVVAPTRALDEMKYLCALLFIGRSGAPEFKQTGAHAFGVGARYLLRFMQANSFARFADLDADAFDLFERRIARTLCDPVELAAIDEEVAEGLYDGDGPDVGETPARKRQKTGNRGILGAKKRKPPPVDQEEIGEAAAYMRLVTWRYVRDEAHDLRRVGIEVARFDPFKGSSVKKMAQALGSYSAERIPALPDQVARPILEFAHRMIGLPADEVIDLHDRYYAMWQGKHVDERARDRSCERLVKSATFSPLEEGGAPWTSKRLSARSNGARTVRDLVVLIRDAALIVLQSDTGMRISEVCSIAASPDEDMLPMPSCVSVEPSNSQLNEHFFVHGLLSKGVREPHAEKWLLGGRPAGTEVEPPAVRALRVLVRLLRPWRALAEGDPIGLQLLPSNIAYAWLPMSAEDLGPTIGYSLTRSITNTIVDEVGLKAVLEDAVEGDPELRQYWETDGRCIRSHQWRKTFIRYLIRVDEGLLPAISHHFKHYTLAITEDGYMPRDPELVDIATSVRTRETSRALFERRFGSKHRVGRLDELLAETRSRIQQVIGDDDFVRAAPRLDAFVREHDIQFWFAQHGACLFDMHPSEARCHNQAGRSDWRPRGPDFATRTPDACLGCRNFSVGREAVGFWRDRYVTNQRSWITSGHAPMFRIARMRAKQSAAVLRHLGQPLPILLDKAPRKEARETENG